MKALTNKQRCKNCIHKGVCIYPSHYENVEGLERCKHYYSKERISKQKQRTEKEGCMRCEHGKGYYCSDGKRIYVGTDGSVSVYVNGNYIDLPAYTFKKCPWCGKSLTR